MFESDPEFSRLKAFFIFRISVLLVEQVNCFSEGRAAHQSATLGRKVAHAALCSSALL